MARLEEKMERVSEGAAEQLPDEALEVMDAHTRELVEAGRAGDAVGEGDRAPDFELPSTEGGTIRLSEAAARGPVILSFYRGRW
jgi:hypothetical protein